MFVVRKSRSEPGHELLIIIVLTKTRIIVVAGTVVVDGRIMKSSRLLKPDRFFRLTVIMA